MSVKLHAERGSEPRCTVAGTAASPQEPRRCGISNRALCHEAPLDVLMAWGKGEDTGGSVALSGCPRYGCGTKTRIVAALRRAHRRNTDERATEIMQVLRAPELTELAVEAVNSGIVTTIGPD